MFTCLIDLSEVLLTEVLLPEALFEDVSKGLRGE